MTIKHHESPFHATHDKDTADKMAADVDAGIMNIAQQILEETKNSECQYLEAFYIAESKGEENQLWDEEATAFTFDDDSKLKFSEGYVKELTMTIQKFNVYRVTPHLIKAMIAENVTLEEARQVIKDQPIPLPSGQRSNQTRFVIEHAEVTA